MLLFDRRGGTAPAPTLGDDRRRRQQKQRPSTREFVAVNDVSAAGEDAQEQPRWCTPKEFLWTPPPPRRPFMRRQERNVVDSHQKWGLRAASAHSSSASKPARRASSRDKRPKVVSASAAHRRERRQSHARPPSRQVLKKSAEEDTVLARLGKIEDHLQVMNDPEADGFGALDEDLSPCPFKIQVTPNAGSPLHLKDLGAVAAKTERTLMSSSASVRNIMLKGGCKKPKDRPESATPSPYYQNNGNSTDSPSAASYFARNSIDSFTAISITPHDQEHPSLKHTNSLISFVQDDGEDDEYVEIDSYASSFCDDSEECVEDGTLQTSLGDDFLSLFAP